VLSSACQTAGDGSAQVAAAIGLHQAVVRAGIERRFKIIGVALVGQEDDRRQSDRPVIAHRPDEVEAARRRDIFADQNQPGLAEIQPHEGIGAVPILIDGVVGRQDVFQLLSMAGIAIDNRDEVLVDPVRNR
jgi:hypothetical protein